MILAYKLHVAWQCLIVTDPDLCGCVLSVVGVCMYTVVVVVILW